MYAVQPERETETEEEVDKEREKERENNVDTFYTHTRFIFNRLPPFHFSMKSESTQEKQYW